MKFRYLFFLAFFWLTSSFSQNNSASNNTTIESTTYYFVRHAEKDRSDPSDRNPHLTEKGELRSKKWSEILKNVKFDAVYSTDYNRTRETAQPTASKNSVEITLYDPRNIDITEFKEKTKGKTVFIVGHSNTTPTFVNQILGYHKYEDIDDNNNGNLYIVTIAGTVITDQLLTIN